jgi:hypothetical protein
VPDDGEWVADKIALKHAPERASQCLRRDPRLRLAIGQIAVIAVEVTEWRRLDNQQIQGTELHGALEGCHGGTTFISKHVEIESA